MFIYSAAWNSTKLSGVYQNIRRALQLVGEAGGNFEMCLGLSQRVDDSEVFADFHSM